MIDPSVYHRLLRDLQSLVCRNFILVRFQVKACVDLIVAGFPVRWYSHGILTDSASPKLRFAAFQLLTIGTIDAYKGIFFAKYYYLFIF